MEKEIRTLSHAETNLSELAMRFGPKILVALLFVAAGLLVGRWVGQMSDRALERLQLEAPVRNLLVRLLKILIVGIFLILALQNLGVELLPLIAGLSVAGAGIALATQGVLSNVVAGLTIIFTKPYRIGESIAIVGVDGTVEAITLFSTVLRHGDRSMVVVPNRKIVGEILHNYGHVRQTELSVGVSYDADLARAVALIEGLVKEHPKVLADPAPQIQVSALGPSVVVIRARPWIAVADFGVIEGAIYLKIVDTLRRAGIDIPPPQMQVQLLGTAKASL